MRLRLVDEAGDVLDEIDNLDKVWDLSTRQKQKALMDTIREAIEPWVPSAGEAGAANSTTGDDE